MELCQLADLKSWLGITDTAQDVPLRRLLTAVSDDFLNEIDRQDFAPQTDYTEYYWQHGWRWSFDRFLYGHNRHQEVWLRHYPVNSITTVTVNGEDLTALTDPTVQGAIGYWFNEDETPENRQKIVLINPQMSFPYRATVTYKAGYDEIPTGVQQAIIEWSSFRRGIGQVQQLDQSGGSVTAGTVSYTGDNINMNVAAVSAEIPVNVASVIEQYRRIII